MFLATINVLYFATFLAKFDLRIVQSRYTVHTLWPILIWNIVDKLSYVSLFSENPLPNNV